MEESFSIYLPDLPYVEFVEACIKFDINTIERLIGSYNSESILSNNGIVNKIFSVIYNNLNENSIEHIEYLSKLFRHKPIITNGLFLVNLFKPKQMDVYLLDRILSYITLHCPEEIKKELIMSHVDDNDKLQLLKYYELIPTDMLSVINGFIYKKNVDAVKLFISELSLHVPFNKNTLDMFATLGDYDLYCWVYDNRDDNVISDHDTLLNACIGGNYDIILKISEYNKFTFNELSLISYNRHIALLKQILFYKEITIDFTKMRSDLYYLSDSNLEFIRLLLGEDIDFNNLYRDLAEYKTRLLLLKSNQIFDDIKPKTWKSQFANLCRYENKIDQSIKIGYMKPIEPPKPPKRNEVKFIQRNITPKKRKLHQYIQNQITKGVPFVVCLHRLENKLSRDEYKDLCDGVINIQYPYIRYDITENNNNNNDHEFEPELELESEFEPEFEVELDIENISNDQQIPNQQQSDDKHTWKNGFNNL